MSAKTYPSFAVAIVDDEEYALVCLENLLRAEGITNVLPIKDPRSLPALIEESSIGIVLLDLALPGMDGRELLALLRRDHPQVSVIVITGNRDIDRAVECMRLGASDYLTKPVDGARMVISLRHLIELQELLRENLDMRDRLLRPRGEASAAFGTITTAGRTMGPLIDYAEMIATTSHPVMITGETGVGKELFARAIHEKSGREGEFVAVNVAGLDDAFFSDLLFGHRAGAYTGSQGGLEGLIERAKNGSLFLDEIGDLSHSSQVKLLRVIESGEYYPLGSDLLKRSRARIIVATNRDLDKAIETGAFRKDLFYRLNIHHVHIPPLRERKEDIAPLAELFIAESAAELSKRIAGLAPEFLEQLGSLDFPGNVRELRAIIFDAVNSHQGGKLTLRSYKKAGEARRKEPESPAALTFPCPLPTLKELSELLFDEALLRAKGNQSLAARLLGISPQAVSKRLRTRQTRIDNLG